MKRALLLLAVASFSSAAFAEGLTIKSTEAKFTVARIKASKVKAVKVRLFQEVTRRDCNIYYLNFNLTFVSGNRDFAWHQTNFANAGTSMTEMGCPLETPVTETIYSKYVELPSLRNENADGEVDVTIILPSRYQIEAEEVALDESLP